MSAPGTPTLERINPPQPPHAFGRGGGWEGSEQPATPPAGAARIAVWLLVGAITVLFAALTSTYLVRRAETDWQTGPLPSLLWLTTVIIAASSVTLERAKRSARRGAVAGFRAGLGVTTGLGAAFLAGQIVVWRQLVAAGVYLATNPHSSFFYILTGAHGVHLIGGIGGLLYALRKVRGTTTPAAALDVGEPVATYWHFLTGLWIWLFLILFWL